jgi:uncharacterized HAD superfamily protein
MLRIALDFDNVLADTTGAWLRYYNKNYNKSIDKSDLNEYYFWDILNISKNEAFKIFSIVWSNWKELPLLEKDSISIVNGIARIAEIDLVTSALVDMKDWITNKNFKFNKIIYTQQKKHLKYDIFIEDSPYEAMNIVKNNKICILYDQPWNRLIQCNNLIRITKLKEVMRLIKKYGKEGVHTSNVDDY